VDDQQLAGRTGARRAEGAAGPDKDDDRDRHGDRISVGSGDENVAKIQLSARWAEQYAPEGDTLDAALQRFNRVYVYIDSVTKLVDPPEI